MKMLMALSKTAYRDLFEGFANGQGAAFATMKRCWARIRFACGQLFDGFVQTRLMAELPGADDLIRHRFNHSRWFEIG